MDSNLNAFLFPNDSPYVLNQDLTNGYVFDWQNEASIITNSKIRNLNADKIISGTIDASIITVSNLIVNPEDINNGTLNTTINVGSATGSAYVRMDGPNVRFAVHDGTNLRGIFGKV